MQTARARLFWPVVILGVAAIAGFLGYSIGAARCTPHSEPSSIRPWDKPFVDKALALYGHGKIPLQRVQRSNSINVVYLPAMTCVGFNLLPGSNVGGDNTVCLDKSGQRVVLTYMHGE